MPDKIRMRRGNKANLPTLDDGEMGLAEDTRELFIGTTTVNLQLIYQRSGFSAAKGAASQVVSSSTVTKVIFDSEAWDYLSEYDPATSLFTAKQAGDYLVNASIYVAIPTDQAVIEIRMYKNGTLYSYLTATPGSGTTSCQISAAGQAVLSIGDTLSIYVYSTSGFTIGNNATLCFFQCHRLN